MLLKKWGKEKRNAFYSSVQYPLSVLLAKIMKVKIYTTTMRVLLCMVVVVSENDGRTQSEDIRKQGAKGEH